MCKSAINSQERDASSLHRTNQQPKKCNGFRFLQARQRHQAQDGGGDALLPRPETGTRRAGPAARREQGETTHRREGAVGAGGNAAVDGGRHGGRWQQRRGARRRRRRRRGPPRCAVHIEGAGAVPARAHGRRLEEVLLIDR
jgi:hypothetical protein